MSRNWRQRAACLDTEPELFFLIGSTGPALEQTHKAKKICASCSVSAQCLEYALKTNQVLASGADCPRTNAVICAAAALARCVNEVVQPSMASTAQSPRRHICRALTSPLSSQAPNRSRTDFSLSR
jgi:hypothetical protein